MKTLILAICLASFSVTAQTTPKKRIPVDYSIGISFSSSTANSIKTTGISYEIMLHPIYEKHNTNIYISGTHIHQTGNIKQNQITISLDNSQINH